MSKKGKFLLGAGLGVGLGFLLAPKKGEETRKEFKESIDNLIKKVKAIDIETVKENLTDKIAELQTEIRELDKEKAKDLAVKKAKDIKKKADELVKIAIEKGTPAVQKAAEDVRELAAKSLKVIASKIEPEKTKEK